jgi:hypothetical protein
VIPDWKACCLAGRIIEKCPDRVSQEMTSSAKRKAIHPRGQFPLQEFKIVQAYSASFDEA